MVKTVLEPADAAHRPVIDRSELTVRILMIVP